MSHDLRDFERWMTSRLIARLWYCGDEECDCTQPVIERITPNVEAGYPWIKRETLWEGKFLSLTFEYSAWDREETQFAPMREACRQHGVPIPEEVEAQLDAASESRQTDAQGTPPTKEMTP